MINPDGVTIGNSRGSLVGVDLNRRWVLSHHILHPEVHFLKMSMMEQKQISIFIDFHGHNKNQNAFFYGCSKARDEGFLSWTKPRLLPKIFAS
jgi:murein tripeptide amidase MpaA